MKIKLNRRAATIVAGAALTSAAVATVAPTAAFADVGIRLSTSHAVGVYGYYKNIDNNHKVAQDLYPWMHDGIDADCYSRLGANLGYGTTWYHTVREYHNDAGWTEYVYGWTYAPYVDNSAAVSKLPDCHY